jgi:hypothetical protein
MKIRIFLFLQVIWLFTVVSCKESSEELPRTGEPDIENNFPKTQAKVIIGEGINLGFGNLEILSYGMPHAVNVEGKSEIAHNPGVDHPVFIFDDQDRLLMAGFMTSSNSEVSVKSTAEFLLFLGFDMQAEGKAAREKFIREVQELPVFESFLTDLESLYRSDPYTLDKGLYVDALKKAVAEIYEIAVPNGRLSLRVSEDEEVAGTVLVDGNIKSYLQVYDSGINRFKITHTARRRVKGFLYRTSYVDKAGTEHSIIDDISTTSSSDQIIEIPAVSGVKDLGGTLVSFLVGKISETASVDSEDFSLPLKSSESSVNNVLRIVGPGISSDVKLSEFEKKQLFRLWVESLTLDFLLPLIADGISVSGLLSESSGSALMDPVTWDQVISFLIANIDQVQNIKPYLDRGDYKGALAEYLVFLLSEAGKSTFEDLSFLVNHVLISIIDQRYYIPHRNVISERYKKVVKVLQVADLAIKSTDYMRMVYHIANSSHAEEWELKVREIPMNMVPERFSISPINQRLLTVNILSTIADDQVIEYAWESTGKYGYLWDDRGHKGNSFSSSIKEAYYLCNADRLNIPENAKDTVTVNAYIKQGNSRIKIGTVQTIIDVNDLRVFKVPFEPNVPFQPLWPGEYSVGGPRFIAKFPEDDNARSYQLRIMNSAGQTGAPVTRTPAQIPVWNGMHEFVVGIGSPSVNIVNAEQRDKLVAQYMEILNGYASTYAFLEVTVIPK